MLIPTIIHALLEDNSVTITGLGTFHVKKLSAHVKDDVVFPPQNIIELEYSKYAIGYDFGNKFSRWEQITLDEAQAKIAEWVDLIEKGLEYNKNLFFDDFGAFSKDPDKIIIFKGMFITQLNVENEGFEPVVIPSRDYREDEAPVKDKRMVLHNKKKKRDRFWFLLIAIVAVALLCALLLKDPLKNLYYHVIKNIKTMTKHENMEEESVIYISKIAEEEEGTVVDTIIDTVEEPIIETAESSYDHTSSQNVTTAAKPQLKRNPMISLSSYQGVYLPYKEGYCYLIAGSFSKEENALLHIQQRNLDQYNAKLIVAPDSPRIRVCIGIFDNEEDAKQIGDYLNKTYWVLK